MTGRTITIEDREIGISCPPYVIAEMSANHNGKIETALGIIDAAKMAGADAVKIQTYTPETITLNSDREDFLIRGGLWDGRTLHDLYREAHMSWDWHAPLFDHARKTGITLFSSPFDNTAVDLLEDLNAPAYKIASLEIVDLPLIRYVGRTGKPMIISTGIADAAEIEEAIEAAREGGCDELALLHCVTGYPAPASDYNLRTIPDMAERFGVAVGLSDHTLGSATAIASIALGAAIVEKHFTLDRSGGGPDDSFSLEPTDLTNLCRDIRTAWGALGRVSYEIKVSEQQNLAYRPSIYVSRDVQAGDLLSEDNVRTVRPGFGLACKHLNDVIGQKFLSDVELGTPLSWDLITAQEEPR